MNQVQSKFLRTLTVPQFKQEFGVQTIDVIPNPKKEGKLFISFGGKVGHIADKFNKDKEPAMSLVLREGSDEAVWVLHNKSEANVLYSL